MKHPPEHPPDPLELDILHALRTLPREPAAEGFTARVLQRLDEPRRPAPRFRLRPAAAGAALAALAAAVALVVGLRGTGTAPAPPAPQVAVRDARAALEELRREQRRLERELTALSQLTASDGPVIYIGGDETLDLVLDLGSEAPGTVQPASHRVPAPPRRR